MNTITHRLCRLLVFSLVVALTACSDDQKENDLSIQERNGTDNKQIKQDISAPKPSSPVLAKVNGTLITEDDLLALLIRVSGNRASEVIEQTLQDKNKKSKLLEGLVNTRAMALLQEQRLSPDERRTLDRQVAAYKEELLVKKYLEQHAQVQSVSNEMVKKYYQENQQQFAESVQYRFELLTSYGELSDEIRKAIIEILGQAKTNQDWKVLEKKLIQKKLPIRYQQAETRLSLLSEDLQNLLSNTASSSQSLPQVSDVDISNNVKVIRVIEMLPERVKPLSEVSANIRKKLAPVMMKKTVAKLSQEAREQVEISY